MLCALVMVVSVVALSERITAATGSTFKVGYARVDINPWADPYDSDGDGSKGGIMQLPLRGFGSPMNRQSVSGLIDDNGNGKIDDEDGLFATCIAVTDANGETVLLISAAIIGGFDSMVDEARASIVTALAAKGVSITGDRIMIAGTHTHSSIDLSQYVSSREGSTTTYKLQDQTGALTSDTITAGQVYENFQVWYPYMISQLTASAVEAIEDQAPATMKKGQIEATETAGVVMNSVRQYTRVSSSGDLYVCGDNSNLTGISNTGVTADTSEANDTLYLLQFSFTNGNKPIVLANWRAHPSLNGRSGTRLNVSSDYINCFNNELKDAGYRAAFFQGASGNMNPTSKIPGEGEWITATWGDNDGDGIWEGNELAGNVYGYKLAEVALQCLKKNMASVSVGDIKTTTVTYSAEAKSWTEEVQYYAALTAEEYYDAGYSDGAPFVYPSTVINNTTFYNSLSSTLKAKATAFNQSGDSFVIGSVYHAADVIDNYLADDTVDLEMTAIALGEGVAFVTAPGEMYDRYSSSLTWSKLTSLSQSAFTTKVNSYNDWDKLLGSATGGSYDTPFVLGYCNSHVGYFPNNLAYTYNADSTFAATGSYEAHCTEVAQGTGEKMMSIYQKMLTALSSEDADTVSGTSIYLYKECSVCQETVLWNRITQEYNNGSELADGHYYVRLSSGDTITSATKYLSAGATVCLDLNKRNISATGRAFILEDGETLNIMDNYGGAGWIAGTGGSNATANYGGGTIYLGQGSALNLYSGVLTQTLTDTNYVAKGGVVFVKEGAALNVYGGSITGGRVNAQGRNVVGGNVYLENGAAMYMAGGTVSGGTAVASDGYTASAENIYVLTTATLTLSGDANVENAYFYSYSNNNLGISGLFTGSALLQFRSTPAAGKDIGVNDRATILTDDLTIDGSTLIPTTSGTDLVVAAKSECTYCGQSCFWTSVYPETWTQIGDELPGRHYYLDEDVSGSVKSLASNATACIDLRDHNITGTGRVFTLDAGETLNVVDTTGNGSISGCGGTSSTSGFYGGTMSIAEGSILNLHSGTLTQTVKDGYYVARGGVLNVKGTFNMYGGTVTGGQVVRTTYTKDDGTVSAGSTYGGNIYINGGTMTMSGGTVSGGKCYGDDAGNGGNIALGSGGTLTMTGGNVCDGVADSYTEGVASSGGNILVSSDCSAAIFAGTISGGTATLAQDVYVEVSGSIALSGSPDIGQLYLRSHANNNMTISGVFTGSVELKLHNAVTAGDVIGISDNALIASRGFTICDSDLMPLVVGDDVVATAASVCQCCTESCAWIPLDNTLWTRLEGNLPSAHYQLTEDITAQHAAEGVDLYTNVCLDLAGYDITCSTGRLYRLNDGATMRIADSGEGGQIITSGLPATVTSNIYGGMFYIRTGGLLQLYSGTLTMDANATDYVTRRGGIIYTYGGTFDMYGGTVTGGKVSYTGGDGYGGNIGIAPNGDNEGGTVNLYGGTISDGTSYGSSKGYGGNIQVFNYGTLNAYGGQITGGTATSASYGNCVRLSPNGMVNLMNDSVIDQVSLPIGKLKVTGVYTGSAVLRFTTTPTDGTVIGVSDDATIITENLTIYGSELVPTVSGTDLIATGKTVCEYCGVSCAWTPLSDANMETLKGALPSGHYYLTEDVTLKKQATLATNAKVCFDLRDNTLTGGTRAFELANSSNAVLHLMDTNVSDEKVGTVQGYGGTADSYAGGTVFVGSTTTFYLHSGQLQQATKSGYGVSDAGVVRVRGTFYMSGGKIVGGTAANTGGAVSVNTGCNFYMSGGEITGGTAPTGSCVYSLGTVTLSGSAVVADICYGAIPSDTFVIDTTSGSYSGSVNLTYPGTPQAGDDIGNCTEGMDAQSIALTVTDSECLVVTDGTNLLLKGVSTIIVGANGEETAYAYISQAVSRYQGTEETIVLAAVIDEQNITVSEDVVVDLNGFSFTSDISVSNGAKITVQDSQTDDFTVADSEGNLTGYGKLPVSMASVVEPEEGYLMITENDGISFHKVVYNVDYLIANTEDASLNYECSFAGDEIVKENVESYGVAVSIQGEPTVVDGHFDSTCQSTTFTQDEFVTGKCNEVTGARIVNILEETKSTTKNKRSAQTPMYGVSYIKLTNGTYLLSDMKDWSLREAIEALDMDPSAAASDEMMALYKKFSAVMNSWDISNIIKAAAKK